VARYISARFSSRLDVAAGGVGYGSAEPIGIAPCRSRLAGAFFPGAAAQSLIVVLLRRSR